MINETIKNVVVIVMTVALLLFIFYFSFSWYYKAELLLNPCENCAKYNPHLQKCFETSSTKQTNNFIVDFVINESNNNISEKNKNTTTEK